MSSKKKVLIISKELMEVTTEIVMDWICHLGHECYRLNGDIFEHRDENITISSKIGSKFLIKGADFKKNYHSIWLRRWSDYQLIENVAELCENYGISLSLSRKIISCIAQNSICTEDFILDMLKGKKVLTTKSQTIVNKITVLIEAKKIGLNTPNFLLTTSKKRLLSFIKTEKIVVAKELDGQFTFQKGAKRYLCYVDLIDSNKIELIPNQFNLSFFQAYIEKEFEIRSFVLNKEIYSMAIFSQSDPATKIDFRRYNNINPNRKVPYKLPSLIEKKLLNLMTVLKLSTGSIDIIKSTDNKYYFLEVNPVGQFGMVSHPCNYNLELKIAKYLTS